MQRQKTKSLNWKWVNIVLETGPPSMSAKKLTERICAAHFQWCVRGEKKNVSHAILVLSLSLTLDIQDIESRQRSSSLSTYKPKIISSKLDDGNFAVRNEYLVQRKKSWPRRRHGRADEDAARGRSVSILTLRSTHMGVFLLSLTCWFSAF